MRMRENKKKLLNYPFTSSEPLGLSCNEPRDQETTGSGNENA